MLLYYDNNGKLVTVSPHGEIPRQGGGLKLYVLMNKNFNTTNRLMVARFKTPSMTSFSADFPMENKGVLVFRKLPGENIGSLIDGEEYLWFEVDLTNTLANKESGKLKITFTIWKNDGQNPPQLIPGATVVLGMAMFYVEETLGLAPYSGVGMTYTEYQSLMAYLMNGASLDDYYTKNESEERYLKKDSLDDYYTKDESEERYLKKDKFLTNAELEEICT